MKYRLIALSLLLFKISMCGMGNYNPEVMKALQLLRFGSQTNPVLLGGNDVWDQFVPQATPGKPECPDIKKPLGNSSDYATTLLIDEDDVPEKNS